MRGIEIVELKSAELKYARYGVETAEFEIISSKQIVMSI